MFVAIDYASPSMLDSTRDEARLGFSANARRPVRFSGNVVRHGFPLRIALRALGETIWSNDMWFGGADFLDPVITVHPDRVFFEAFSQDQSAYACLIVDPDIFETEGEVVTGTTNVDFTAWLWGALSEMRTSRKTRIQIGAEGFEIATQSAGGRFEQKVDLPDSWVRGFLQVQAAMAMPGTRLRVQPVDLLSAIRFTRITKAKVSPRALRYEMEPGQDARLILEPWEHIVPLVDADHNYTETKTTRVWGRRRLRLIEGLLPFAESVDIYLKGRALPSFYAVRLPGMTFVLGVTGWSGKGFTGSGGFDLLDDATRKTDDLLPSVLTQLEENYHVSVDEVAKRCHVSNQAATSTLVRLCRRGQCMFDVETRRYRHRELFETPVDETSFFPPDHRREQAVAFLENDAVHVVSCQAEETRKTINLKTPNGKQSREVVYRDWRVMGRVDKDDPVEVVVNDSGRIIFGRCTCPFFQDNLMNQGPCEHILALFQASESRRIDSATSVPAEDATPAARQPSRWEVDES